MATKPELLIEAQALGLEVTEANTVAEINAAIAAATPAPVEAEEDAILSRYRVEASGDDAHIYERVILNEEYASEKGVKKFTSSNGQVTYYAEQLVKKFSQNIVSDNSEQ